jgi:hypothetical protein
MWHAEGVYFAQFPVLLLIAHIAVDLVRLETLAGNGEKSYQPALGDDV